jgi:hypothetical protein
MLILSAIWPLIHELGLCFEGRDSGRSLASRIFSRSDSKTQTQYLTKSTAADEFNFQLNVALLVDFLQSGIKCPLFNIGPKKLEARVLNDSS